VPALVDALNNPTPKGVMKSSVLGQFFKFKEDAPDGSSLFLLSSPLSSPLSHTACRALPAPLGELIASEGRGEFIYVEMRVLTTGLRSRH
jgi:hypothetical protein